MAERELSILVKAKGALKAAGDIGKVDKGIRGLSTRSIAAGTAIGTGIERLAERGISALFNQISAGEASLRQLQDAEAQTAAVIESTGAKAGVTAAQVRAQAEALEDLTTVDDKVIQSGENMLLTFTNIGKGVFPQATKAMVDMAVAMNGGNAEGIDLKTTAIQLGKALNDPVKGVGALRRVGVALTAQQEEQIAAFVKNGDIMSAQKIILNELTTEFGKAGEAAGKSGAAGVRRLGDSAEDTQLTLARGLSPALDRIRAKIADTLGKPSTQEAVRKLGVWLGEAAEKAVAFAEGIPWGQVAAGLQAAAGFAGGLVKAFANMPPEVQATILGLAGLNKLSGGMVGSIVGELGKGLIKGVLGMTAGVVNINAASVNAGGAAGAGTGAGGFLGAIGIAGLVTAAAFVVGPIVRQWAIDNGLSSGKSQSQEAHERATGGLGSKNRGTAVKDLTPAMRGIQEEQRRSASRLDQRMERNRIAVQSGTSQIVSAIHGIRFNISVPVTVTGGGFVRTVTRQTGTTLVRVGGNAAAGANLGM